MRRERILILDAGTNAGLAFIRSLGTSTATHILAADSDPRCPAFRSRYCRGTATYPSPLENRAGFQSSLLKLVRRLDPIMLFPMTDQTISCLQEIRPEIEKSCLVAAGPPEAYERLSRKDLLGEAARTSGCAVPATAVPAAGDPELRWKSPESAGRWVVKPAVSVLWRGNRGFKPGMFYAQDSREVSRRVDELHALGATALVQEFIKGREEGYFCLAENGKIRVDFQHRRIRDKDPQGSGSCFRKSVPVNPGMRAAAAALLAQTGWSGLIMFEFLAAAEANYLIDINARPWGSMHLPIACGVDFPFLYYRQLKGLELPPVQCRLGRRVRWLLGDIKHVEALARSAGSARSSGQLVSFALNVLKVMSPLDWLVAYDDFSHRDPAPGWEAIRRHFFVRLAGDPVRRQKKRMSEPAMRLPG